MITVLVDTDGGVDDAAALLYLLREQGVKVAGILATGSSRPVEIVIQAVGNVLATVGRLDVPIAPGLQVPIPASGKISSGNRFHGHDGLGGKAVRIDTSLLHLVPLNQLIEGFLNDASGERVILTIGPLTTMMTVVTTWPEISGVTRLVSMGGAFRVPGNATAAAESNFARDPEAAAFVLGSNWLVPPNIVSLDVTMQAQLTPELLSLLDEPRTSIARFLEGPMKHYLGAHCTLYGGASMPCHDLLAAMSIRDEGLVDYLILPVAVATGSSVASGVTVADMRPWVVGGLEPPDERFRLCRVPVSVDVERFAEGVRTRLLG